MLKLTACGAVDDLEVPHEIRVYRPPWARELSNLWPYYDTKDVHVRSDRSIHGFFELSPGYALAHVPRDAIVKPSPRTTAEQYIQTKELSSHDVSTNYSFPKAFIAIAQLVFASYTLYESSGSQIDKYGYAAFGLTVTPYALMSLLNLAGALVTPSFPSLFIVHSTMMDEAVSRGSRFDGVVGTLYEIALPKVTEDFLSGVFPDDSDSSTDTRSLRLQDRNIKLSTTSSTSKQDPKAAVVFVPSSPCFERQKTYSYTRSSRPKVFLQRSSYDDQAQMRWTGEEQCESSAITITLMISAISLAVIGGMSGFRAHDSRPIQQTLSMAWVSVGIYVGSAAEPLQDMMLEIHRGNGQVLSKMAFWWLKMIEAPWIGLRWILKRVPGRLSLHVVEAISTAIRYSQKARGMAFILINLAVYCVPSIGGLIMVGIMMHEFGVCTKL